MTTNNNFFKISALLRFIYEEENENFYPGDCRIGNDDTFELPDGKEYLILTADEADAKAGDYIKNSLWAFNANFILSTCGLATNSNVVKSLQRMQEEACEACNDFILAFIEGTCGLDEFIQEAIFEDGRGHFLSPYDETENEIILGNETYYIYRVN